ncbi:DUF5071 domain-containing protein [Gottfriedia luciferensis]|uniref:DUF5071 domain-containing protein n=1 Tax=Gottfriedia luciferensis TaxID=178774 RepID=UPI000B44C549|nr:DUF5071 domain-containing protein [Gottfriedia luciferensis]
MNEISNLLPRDKFDFERVNELKQLNKSDLIPVLPNLLEWIQDMNWPIAKETAKLLLNFPSEIVPYIKIVLQSDDYIWKYWCLSELVKKLPIDSKILFKDELEKLANSPTPDEQLEELDEIALEILGTL